MALRSLGTVSALRAVLPSTLQTVSVDGPIAVLQGARGVRMIDLSRLDDEVRRDASCVVSAAAALVRSASPQSIPALREDFVADGEPYFAAPTAAAVTFLGGLTAGSTVDLEYDVWVQVEPAGLSLLLVYGDAPADVAVYTPVTAVRSGSATVRAAYGLLCGALRSAVN